MSLASSAETAGGGDLLRFGRPLAILAIVLGFAAFPRLAGQYQTVVLTYGLIMAIAAMGFNLLLGYTGLLSFGHSAYFGMGAYTVAMILRDLGTASMEVGIVTGLGVTLVISGLFGIACVRHTKIFFGILTLALSQVLWSFAFKFYLITGGSDGMRTSYAKVSLLAGLLDFRGRGAFERFTFSYYYYVLVIFIIAMTILWVIVRSPFGMALQAIRDNETRAKFIGIPVARFRWLAFVISSLFTGLAGVLWVPLNGHVTPDILYWPHSGEIVFMAVLGGFRSFVGPIVGAILFTYLRTYAIAVTEYWQLVLGSLLIILVLLLPSGIVGSAQRAIASRFGRAQ